jgi:ABC-type uncharacterized transport system involved in gliding motility auxiliary subunit
MKRYETLIYSAGGVIIVLLILVLANFVFGALKQRIDLTDGGLYTLSPGTRAIVEKLESPVKIRFYYSQSGENVPLPLKGFARRVDDLLGEFRQAGGGKVQVEKLDPKPDTDAEESAALEGVEAQQLPTGDRFYLGLSISYADQKIAMPVLSLDREQLLEYDIARAIARATRTDKPVIGVLTPMTLFGSRGMPQMGIPPSDKQVFISELERDFTVKRVSPEATTIDDDIQVLLVIHPRGIGEETEYAVDQFVLRGGKLIAMIDPFAYFDVPPGAREGGTPSNLETLLKGWGLAMDATKVIQDLQFSSGQGAQQMSTVLSLNTEAFNADDITTGKLGFSMIPMAGAITGTPAAGLKQTVLIHSSRMSMLTDTSNATTQGEASVRGFKPSETEYAIAVKLTGQFKTAFAKGAPEPKKEEAKKGAPKAAKAEAKPAPGPHLAEGKGENTVVLIADSDFINDGAAVHIQEIFGQKIVVPANSNLSFAQALVDQFAGDPALIDVRTRAVAARPFTVIRDMEARAAQSYMGRLKQLEDDRVQTQQKLESLQKVQPGQGQAAILTAEQQQEVETFRRRAVELGRELRDVRRDLRADSEALQFWTKVVNIALMPLLVAIFGVAFAMYRRRRTAAI